MTSIVFTDPPPPRNNGSAIHPWPDIARQLRARPGEWALVLRGVRGVSASAIRQGKYADLRPAGAFDARTVTRTDHSDGKAVFDIYVKFIGEDAGHGDETD